MKRYLFILTVIMLGSCSAGNRGVNTAFQEKRTTITANPGGKGPEINIDFYRGRAFNYPLFALWLENADGTYIQTLYVARSVATGVFKYGKEEKKHVD
jgi:hypothetical protein